MARSIRHYGTAITSPSLRQLASPRLFLGWHALTGGILRSFQAKTVFAHRRVLKIVLLISCAHALVHLLEQSIASVETVISSEYGLDKTQSAYLGSALRFPYGLGAILAGLLADRIGGKRVLLLYLFGAATVCASFLFSRSSGMVYGQLFALGSLASIYHPAGLGILANETTVKNRSRALGLHGIFGSVGIASAPFLAAIMLTIRPGEWRTYYVLLAALSGCLGLLIWWNFKPTVHQASNIDAQKSGRKQDKSKPAVVTSGAAAVTFQLKPYLMMIASGACGGIVYGGVLHFLPRYLQESGSGQLPLLSLGSSISLSAIGNYAAALALVCGAFGQYTAGRWATPKKLPRQISTAYALNIPFLIWMTFAEGPYRLLAACLWAFVHFMNQPLYNSLLSEFVPQHRRSLGFGFSNMLGFGIGALGPTLVAWFGIILGDYTNSYAVLALSLIHI